MSNTSISVEVCRQWYTEWLAIDLLASAILAVQFSAFADDQPADKKKDDKPPVGALAPAAARFRPPKDR